MPPGVLEHYSKLFTFPRHPSDGIDLEIANIRGHLAVAKRSLQEDKAEPRPQDYLKARKLDIDDAFRGQPLDPELRQILMDHLGELRQLAQLANRPGARLLWSRDGVAVLRSGAVRHFSLPAQAEKAYRIFRHSDLYQHWHLRTEAKLKQLWRTFETGGGVIPATDQDGQPLTNADGSPKYLLWNNLTKHQHIKREARPHEIEAWEIYLQAGLGLPPVSKAAAERSMANLKTYLVERGIDDFRLQLDNPEQLETDPQLAAHVVFVCEMIRDLPLKAFQKVGDKRRFREVTLNWGNDFRGWASEGGFTLTSYYARAAIRDQVSVFYHELGHCFDMLPTYDKKKHWRSLFGSYITLRGLPLILPDFFNGPRYRRKRYHRQITEFQADTFLTFFVMGAKVREQRERLARESQLGELDPRVRALDFYAWLEAVDLDHNHGYYSAKEYRLLQAGKMPLQPSVENPQASDDLAGFQDRHIFPELFQAFFPDHPPTDPRLLKKYRVFETRFTDETSFARRGFNLQHREMRRFFHQVDLLKAQNFQLHRLLTPPEARMANADAWLADVYANHADFGSDVDITLVLLQSRLSRQLEQARQKLDAGDLKESEIPTELLQTLKHPQSVEGPGIRLVSEFLREHRYQNDLDVSPTPFDEIKRLASVILEAEEWKLPPDQFLTQTQKAAKLREILGRVQQEVARLSRRRTNESFIEKMQEIYAAVFYRRSLMEAHEM